MRHQQKGFKLGRTSSHRAATLAALSTALIKHKRITTTHTKAKALRLYVEPILNRAKSDTSHSRRQVFRYLQDKEAVTELFGDIAAKIGERPGGYTRIIKLGQRAGDAAPMASIELVDYNDVRPDGASGGSSKRRTRRGRSRSSAKSTAKATAAATAAEVEEVVEDVVDESPEAAAVEEADVATEEEAAAEEAVAEEATDEPGAEEATDDSEDEEKA